MTATTPQQQTLAAFAAAVRASPHNLLSQRALDELESRHIAESEAFGASLPPNSRVLDLGTGGGFPGMVVAITRPDLRVTLLDATRKKVEFLEEFAERDGIAVETLTGRAEDLHATYGGRFDIVTARAVAPLDRLIGWALPFLRPGGELHAIKGARWAEELKTALPAIKQCGAQVVGVPGSPKIGEYPRISKSHAEVLPRVVIIRTAG